MHLFVLVHVHVQMLTYTGQCTDQGYITLSRRTFLNDLSPGRLALMDPLLFAAPCRHAMSLVKSTMHDHVLTGSTLARAHTRTHGLHAHELAKHTVYHAQHVCRFTV